MPFIETPFEVLVIFEPTIFKDSRGYFFESYNDALFQQQGFKFNWVQDNQAQSSYGVVRGLHFQAPPYAQTKLIRALTGSILDVVVDLRKDQPTFGKSFAVELSDENKRQLLIPAGFAHGYSVLSETATVMYKCDQLYNKASEGGIHPFDPALSIDWNVPADQVVLSEKDKLYPSFINLESPF